MTYQPTAWQNGGPPHINAVNPNHIEQGTTDAHEGLDGQAQRERARQVFEVLHRGATDLVWSTRYDVEDGLRWDAEREVWTASDGFAFDGSRLQEYSRAGSA